MITPSPPDTARTPRVASSRSLHSLVSALERRSAAYLGAFTLLFAIATMAKAQHRFWYDEFFTLYISRLPNFSDIFRALADGLDFNPPLIYAATRFSHSLFGVSPMTTRLPEMLGVLVLCFCVFVFTRRRLGVLYGFAAMCFPLLTAAYSCASDARPYGIILGFCGLLAISWQSATGPQRHYGHLAGVLAAATGLMLTHCYVVLIFIAFGVAEVVRLRRRRLTDWPLWFSLFSPLSLGLFYMPMLRNVRGYAVKSVAFESSLALVPRFYSFLFNNQNRAIDKPLSAETIWPLLLALLFTCMLRKDNRRVVATETVTWLPAHELALLSALAALPVFGNVLAMISGSPFLDRYAISAVFGISVLLAVIAARASERRRELGAGLAVGFLLWFTVSSALWFGGLFKEPKPWDFPYTKLADLPADAPIVIADPLMFLEANYYEPPEVAARLRFITNREAALRITGTDVFDRGYYTMRRWFPIKGKVVEYSLFRQTEKHYYVFGSFDNPEDWFIRTLLRDGVPVLARGQYRYAASHGDESVLLEVCQGTKLTGSTACE